MLDQVLVAGLYLSAYAPLVAMLWKRSYVSTVPSGILAQVSSSLRSPRSLVAANDHVLVAGSKRYVFGVNNDPTRILPLGKTTVGSSPNLASGWGRRGVQASATGS